MEELETLIFDAWEKLEPQILTNPAELQRRLARRSSKSFLCPPRAWCLVVRASDRRIDDYFGWRSAWQGFTGSQEIELTAPLVRKLNEPIATDHPYTRQLELAQKLGCSKQRLRSIADRGLLDRRHIPLLGGQRGKVPVLFSSQLLDPGSAKSFRFDHFAWGTQFKWLCERVPDDLHQVVQRVPVYKTIRLNPNRKLPAEWRDYVWYRWTKDGQYIYNKYDLRRQRTNQRDRERRRQKREDRIAAGDPPRTHARVFIGWRLICPACNRTARQLYRPLFAVKAWRLLGDRDPAPGTPGGMPLPNPRFLCKNCHNIAYHKPKNRAATWNLLITQASGGLLYGHEVRHPDWYPAKGKSDYWRRIEERREEVQQRVLAGEKTESIAADMSVSFQKVQRDISLILRSHKVKNRIELARKLGVTIPQPGERIPVMRNRIEALMRLGRSPREIADALGSTRRNVTNNMRKIYALAGVHSRNQWMALMNLPAVPKQFPIPAPKRDRIAALLRRGLTPRQIASAMNLSRNSAQTVITKLYRLAGVHSRQEWLQKLAAAPAAADALPVHRT